MRWYEYTLTLEPGQTLTNTVIAPLYPAIDAGYTPSIYTYTYLLSPAKTWAQFGELKIVVNTPYYMTENNQGSFLRTEKGADPAGSAGKRADLHLVGIRASPASKAIASVPSGLPACRFCRLCADRRRCDCRCADY